MTVEMRKYKNYIALMLFAGILFACGFYAGKQKERESLLEKLTFVTQYAILLEEENSMLMNICRGGIDK